MYFVLALVWGDNCLQHAGPEKDFLHQKMSSINTTHDTVLKESVQNFKFPNSSTIQLMMENLFRFWLSSQVWIFQSDDVSVWYSTCCCGPT